MLLREFFVPCNEKLENFANLQKEDTIMPEFLSDPSGPNELCISLYPMRFKRMRYMTHIIVRLRLSKPITRSPSLSLSLHGRLQFTMEVGEEGRLSFLDTTLIVEEHMLVFDLYRKATFSGRFLNFNSHHPLCHKKDVNNI